MLLVAVVPFPVGASTYRGGGGELQIRVIVGSLAIFAALVACEDIAGPRPPMEERLSFDEYAEIRCDISRMDRRIRTWAEGREFYPWAYGALKGAPPPDELWEWHSATIETFDATARESLVRDGAIPDFIFDTGSPLAKAYERYWKAVDALDRDTLARLFDAGCRFD